MKKNQSLKIIGDLTCIKSVSEEIGNGEKIIIFL